MKDIAFVIITIRDFKVANACIDSIKTHSKDLSYDIYILFNGIPLPDKIPEDVIVKRLDKMKYPSGAKLYMEDFLCDKSYKYIFMLDDDIEIVDEGSKKLFDFMESNETVGLCSGSTKDHGSSKIRSGGQLIVDDYFLLRKKWENGGSKGFRETPFVIGGYYIMRNSILKNGVRSDDNISYGFWDIDLPMSVAKAGYKIGVYSKATSIHRRLVKPNQESEKIRKLQWRNRKNYGNSAIYFYKKWGLIPYCGGVLFTGNIGLSINRDGKDKIKKTFDNWKKKYDLELDSK